MDCSSLRKVRAIFSDVRNFFGYLLSYLLTKTISSQFQECQALPGGQGKRIPCLIEHMENITGPCRHFLNRMAKIVFSDYHYVWHFMERCGADVERFKCGRSHTGQSGKEEEEEEVMEIGKRSSKGDKYCDVCNPSWLQIN